MANECELLINAVSENGPKMLTILEDFRLQRWAGPGQKATERVQGFMNPLSWANG